MSYISDLLRRTREFVRRNPTPYSYVRNKLNDLDRSQSVTAQFFNPRTVRGTITSPREVGYQLKDYGKGLVYGLGNVANQASNIQNRLAQNKVARVVFPTLNIQNIPSVKQRQEKQRAYFNQQIMPRLKPTTTTGKVGALVGENLPYMAMPLVPEVAAWKAAGGLTRLAGAGLVRGGENAALGAAQRYGEGQSAARIVKGAPSDLLLGIAANTALSPRLALRAAREIPSIARGVRAVQPTVKIGRMTARTGSVGDRPIMAKADMLVSHEGAPDMATVEAVKKKILNGEYIEPLKIINEGKKYGIEDGKHRYQAYRELGINDIPVEIVGTGRGGLTGRPGFARFKTIYEKQDTPEYQDELGRMYMELHGAEKGIKIFKENARSAFIF